MSLSRAEVGDREKFPIAVLTHLAVAKCETATLVRVWPLRVAVIGR